VPFVLTASFMGQAAGCLFRHRETAVLVFVATTLPQFFLVGVSWPREMRCARRRRLRSQHISDPRRPDEYRAGAPSRQVGLAEIRRAPPRIVPHHFNSNAGSDPFAVWRDR
jgi:hypothetical protein